jgi:hypothetical protein
LRIEARARSRPGTANMEFIVVPGLVPGTHVLTAPTPGKTWMAGT